MTVTNDDNPWGRDIKYAQADRSIGFQDITGQHPTWEHWFNTSLNQGAVGQDFYQLSTGGSSPGIDISTTVPITDMYPRNNVKKTASGHVFELNDAPGTERVLIRHRTGAGIEVAPDGTVTISAQGRHIITVANDMSVIVEGDANLVYKGNVNMTVNGDFNLDVAGNYNIGVDGNHFQSVDGQKSTTVEGSVGTTIKGNNSHTVVGSSTTAIFGNSSAVTKGIARVIAGADIQITSGGTLSMTSPDTLDITSAETNIAGETLNAIGATGTIGGAAVIMYNKNMWTGNSIDAKTSITTDTIYSKSAQIDYIDNIKTRSAQVISTRFDGKLKGVAEKAGSLSLFIAPDAAGVSETLVPADTTATARPTSQVLAQYVNGSGKGAKQVMIDPGDVVVNLLKTRQQTGGITDRPLRNTAEVRSKLRDESNLNNQQFIASQVSTGNLSGNYAKATPNAIGRTAPASRSVVRSQERFGNGAWPTNLGRFQPSNPRTPFTPESRFVIADDAEITTKTPLAQGVTLAKFLGEGDRGTLNIFPDKEKRRQIARNLAPHAEAVRLIKQDTGQFGNYRLRVVEGIYKPGPEETVGGLNELAMSGRAVVYELIGPNGKIDAGKTFDLAVRWKDMIAFEKMILDYDEYDPSGELNVQIVLIMPEMNKDYDGTSFTGAVETKYNGKTISNKELVEILLNEDDLGLPESTLPPTTTV